MSLASKIQRANIALMTGGDLDAIPKFFAPDYVAHVTGQNITGGHAAVQRILRPYRRAFSNLEVGVEILVEGKDRLAWQRTVRAIHKGTFKGFPATGRPIVWRDMVVSRFSGGLIAEDWVITDLAEHLLRAAKR